MNRRVVRRQSLADSPRDAGALRIAFVQSCWHRQIVDQARRGFLRQLAQYGVARRQIDCFEVPGAFEIPLQAKLLAKSGRYAAVVAAGLVVDGGIYRHEFVAAAVVNALMSVQLETEVPVISAVLTPQRFHDHDEHQSFLRKHFVTKGEEAARACTAAIAGIAKLRPPQAGRPLRGRQMRSTLGAVIETGSAG
ncbi:MAG: 6,7-dimethyl-8-ribityllumazine synthase [Steroidobacteraceae bacterium]